MKKIKERQKKKVSEMTGKDEKEKDKQVEGDKEKR